MPKRSIADVSVEIDAEGTVSLTGGRLPPNLVWKPPSSSITMVPGSGAFLDLKATDTALSAFCGKSLKCSAFMDTLRLARDSACEAEIPKLMAEIWGDAATTAGKIKKAALRELLMTDHASSLPSVVIVSMGEHGNFTLPFTSDKRICTAAECSGSIWTRIVAAIFHDPGTNSRLKKVESTSKLVSPHKEVRMEYKRHRAYVNYSDAEGRPRFHSVKIDPNLSGQERTDAFLSAADELHGFYSDNHVDTQGPGSDDAEGGDA